MSETDKTVQAPCNATADAVIQRLPGATMLSTVDLAAALGYSSSRPVLDAIESGKLAAIRITPTSRWMICRAEAVRFIISITEGNAKK